MYSLTKCDDVYMPCKNMYTSSLWGTDLASLLAECEIYTWAEAKAPSTFRANLEIAIAEQSVLVPSNIDRGHLIKDMAKSIGLEEIRLLLDLSKVLEP